MYIYIYRNTSKMRITMETEQQSSAFKRLLETLLLAIKMCTGFTTDVIWCAVSLANQLRAAASATNN